MAQVIKGFTFWLLNEKLNMHNISFEQIDDFMFSYGLVYGGEIQDE